MKLWFVTHPEVVVDPAVPVPRWRLSEPGRARMGAFLASGTLDAVRAIWASDETKAVEAAEMAAARLGLAVRIHPGLRENDRSATGFLPPPAFERMADRFFAEPGLSADGWERAVDAQARVVAALDEILAGHVEGDVAVVAHGAVGTLALCRRLGVAIDRAHDQPFQGHAWCWDIVRQALLHPWRPIAPR